MYIYIYIYCHLTKTKKKLERNSSCHKNKTLLNKNTRKVFVWFLDALFTTRTKY